MRKMRIGLQMMWLNDGTHANHIGDAGIAESWAKWLSRRDDVHGVQIFGPESVKLHFNYDVLINFHPGLPIHPLAKNILYSQNAWDESFHPGGTVGVFNAVKDRYQGHLFPSEKLRQLCGGVGTTIPFAADPEVFTYQPDEKYNLPVTFCGNDIRGAELNERYLIPAIPHGLKVWGGPYADPRIQAVHQGRLPEGELPKLYSSSRCNLNIHIKGHAEMEVVNSRIYECLACGGSIATDFHEGMRPFLANSGISLNSGGDRTEYAIGWVGSAPLQDGLTKNSLRWQRRESILAAHTWEKRMADLMAYLKEVV